MEHRTGRGMLSTHGKGRVNLCKKQCNVMYIARLHTPFSMKKQSPLHTVMHEADCASLGVAPSGSKQPVRNECEGMASCEEILSIKHLSTESDVYLEHRNHAAAFLHLPEFVVPKLFLDLYKRRGYVGTILAHVIQCMSLDLIDMVAEYISPSLIVFESRVFQLPRRQLNPDPGWHFVDDKFDGDLHNVVSDHMHLASRVPSLHREHLFSVDFKSLYPSMYRIQPMDSKVGCSTYTCHAVYVFFSQELELQAERQARAERAALYKAAYGPRSRRQHKRLQPRS